MSAAADRTPHVGLCDHEASERLARFGPNVLVPESHGLGFLWVARFFMDPMVVLLLVAGGTYLFLGDRFDAAVALCALVPIFLVTAVLEQRSERALAELKRLASPKARVVRGGREQIVDARGIVPGDVMLVREGDVFVADGTLVDGSVLVVDESTLTGESHPAMKEPPDAHVYAGTALRSGRGDVLVTQTGLRTRYGRIGKLMSQMRVGPTPIERVIRRLVWQIGAGVLVLCAVVIFVEHGRGSLWPAAVIAAVSLAMAAIPEELPMVYTLYLALGAWRLARQHALVRRLASVETLGSANVICVDKTGTLTYGTLEIAETWTARGVDVASLLLAATLACDPEPFDPLDAAVLRFTHERGVDVDADRLVTRYPFDPTHRRVTHLWSVPSGYRVATKGAVEYVLDLCEIAREQRDEIVEANASFARDGMRVLAVAGAPRSAAGRTRSDDEAHLQFLGLLALSDPVREGVPAAIAACGRAGIAVVMITGDHPDTADATARRLGLHAGSTLTGAQLDDMSDDRLVAALEETRVFARILPEQKLRIVRAFHARGDVVAMTGDGTNDALALREADIGVAMGERGTEVARAAADVVLLDYDFSTIVAAVAGGRRIFRNLRRAFRYLNAFHVPLIISAVVIPVFGAPLLLLPIHLVWLELIVHPTSALVYENDSGDPGELMAEPPRDAHAGLLRRSDWLRPVLLGSALTVGCLAVYFADLHRGYGVEIARGMALATMLFGQMLLVLTERSTQLPVWKQPVKNNPALLPILGGSVVMMLVMLYVPPLAAAFRVAAPTPAHFLESLAVAALCTLWFEPFKRTETPA